MKIFYRCDRSKCNNCLYPMCQHTSSLKHSINYNKRPNIKIIKNKFKKIGDMYYEQM